MWKGCKPKSLQIFALMFDEFASAVFTLLLCSLSPNIHAWKPCKYNLRLKKKACYGSCSSQIGAFGADIPAWEEEWKHGMAAGGIATQGLQSKFLCIGAITTGWGLARTAACIACPALSSPLPVPTPRAHSVLPAWANSQGTELCG